MDIFRGLIRMVSGGFPADRRPRDTAGTGEPPCATPQDRSSRPSKGAGVYYFEPCFQRLRAAMAPVWKPTEQGPYERS